MRLVRYNYPSSRNLAPGVVRSRWAGLESEIDRLFESALADLSSVAAPANRFPVDIYEDKDHVYVRAELPGVTRDDINVEMVNGYLAINAARKIFTEEGKTEESFSLSRTLDIPQEVQSDRVSAAYENGILTVTLPKREEAKPKKVTVAIK